jgi:hypothetical protein
VLAVQSVSASEIGIGSDFAKLESVSAIWKVNISQSVLNGSGIDSQIVELDRMSIECTIESNSSCVKANEIKIKNWLKGRTVTPSFFGNESVIEWTEKDHLFIGFSGIANPEPVNFNGRSFLRLTNISYPFDGRYVMAVGMKNGGVMGELEESDKGALISLTDHSGNVTVLFWSFSGERRLGGVLHSDRRHIVVEQEQKETIVDNPFF